MAKKAARQGVRALPGLATTSWSAPPAMATNLIAHLLDAARASRRRRPDRVLAHTLPSLATTKDPAPR